MLWHQALQSSPSKRAALIAESVRLWPCDPTRNLALVKLQVDEIREFKLTGEALPVAVSRVRRELDSLRRWNPLSWEFQLERAFFCLAFEDDLASARREAEVAIRLNRLQWRIPLRLALAIYRRDSDLAYHWLHAVQSDSPEAVRQKLHHLWAWTQDPGELWQAAPASPKGMALLAEFALKNRLLPMSAQAFKKSSVPPLVAARNLLDAGAADLALQFLENQNGPGAQYLRARSQLRLGRAVEALHLLEKLVDSSETPVVSSGSLGKKVTVKQETGDGTELQAMWREFEVKKAKYDWAGAAEILLRFCQVRGDEERWLR
jgi:hypothetical protein